MISNLLSGRSGSMTVLAVPSSIRLPLSVTSIVLREASRTTAPLLEQTGINVMNGT
jgi:hypothetical protein